MSKRSYRQNCALARASDVIGERWTMLLLRDLLVSPRRFNELQQSLRGIGANLLAARLKDLEAAGVIERRAGDGGTRVYALTKAGQALEPTVLAMIRWGLSFGPENREGDHHQNDWDLLALKALFRPERAPGLSATAQFELTGWARIEEGRMSVGVGSASAPDLEISGTVPDLFMNTEHPQDLLRSGKPDLLRQFMAAFALRHRSGHLLVW